MVTGLILTVQPSPSPTAPLRPMLSCHHPSLGDSLGQAGPQETLQRWALGLVGLIPTSTSSPPHGFPCLQRAGGWCWAQPGSLSSGQNPPFLISPQPELVVVPAKTLLTRTMWLTVPHLNVPFSPWLHTPSPPSPQSLLPLVSPGPIPWSLSRQPWPPQHSLCSPPCSSHLLPLVPEAGPASVQCLHLLRPMVPSCLVPTTPSRDVPPP